MALGNCPNLSNPHPLLALAQQPKQSIWNTLEGKETQSLSLLFTLIILLYFHNMRVWLTV